MTLRSAISLLLLLGLATAAAAQGILREGFEAPEVSLRDAGGDAHYKVELHQRQQQGTHSGRGCERITLRGNNGTCVYFSHEIGPARVISELALSVWVKANRPGLQILARIVLPRSKDPRTGEPLTTLVRGGDYKQAGAWQQLRLENLGPELQRQTRVLRTQFGSQVDAREAYVDRLLLNLYGGPGLTDVWIDDLELSGIVPLDEALPLAANAAEGEPAIADPQVRPASANESAAGAAAPRVELNRLLLVDGRPAFPRIVEYRGEPLAKLQALGFNGVRLDHVPTAEMLREAASLGMWMVAPPPPPAQLERQPGEPNGPQIGSQFDPVLVWDLGSGLAKRELESTRRWAELLEAADSRDRPMACEAEAELRNYTRPPFKLMFVRREPLASTLQLNQYSTWLQERAQLARAGTPLWAVIQTEPAAGLMEQMRLAKPDYLPAVVLQEAQIRNLVYTALAGRARGLCFASRSRLDADDAATRYRAATLELLNLQLALIERWTAAGNFGPGAQTSDASMSGAVLQTDHSRLLLPIFAPANGQFALDVPANATVSFRVSGPEEYDAYELSPTSLRRLASVRKAGGSEVVLNEWERDSCVVFTQDPRILAAIKQQHDRMRRRAADLARELANAELVQVEVTEPRLTEVGRTLPAMRELKIRAQADLRQCEAMLKDNPDKAYSHARHAQFYLRTVQRAHWNGAAPAAPWPLANPFMANFLTLPEHHRFTNEMTNAPRGPNRLADGQFENLNSMLAAGWKNFEHPQPGITTAVELSTAAAYAGRTGLVIRAVPADPEAKPIAVETPPVWVTSAAVGVEQGDLVQIQGWVRVPRPITGSVDGLLIVDTLAGEAMAQRVHSGDEWRQFTLYRFAPRSGPMSVTFAMSGLGEAWIDEVTIQVVERGAAARPQQAQHAPTLGAPNSPGS